MSNMESATQHSQIKYLIVVLIVLTIFVCVLSIITISVSLYTAKEWISRSSDIKNALIENRWVFNSQLQELLKAINSKEVVICKENIN